MKITIDKIKSYGPCESGFNDFVKSYPTYNDSLINLLSLDDVCYDNKIWLATKVVDYKILQWWSLECAESVLENYKKCNSDDNRVSNCLKVNRAYLEGNSTLEELETASSAAYSAARSAAHSATHSAYSAAHSAYSASSAAYSASSAASSAAYSAYSASSAASSAAYSAAHSAESTQEQKNLDILISLLQGVTYD